MKKFLPIILLSFFLISCSSTDQTTSPSNPSPTPINIPSSPSVEPSPNTQASQASQQPAPSPTPVTQLYQNSKYKFKFSYPNDFTLVTPNYANLSQRIVQAQLPSKAYPKTNFGDAGFAISVQPASSLQKCLNMNLPEGSKGYKDTVTLNRVKFYKTTGQGAGAGNFYDTRSYRTLRGAWCFEITEVVHTLNIGNFDPGSVTEVSKDKVWATLQKILSSFAFTS